jgi:adenosylcobinamide kinase/adenosylcobinamide-phosphate guanylyltransferase
VVEVQKRLVLVLGGARSGKSAFGLKLAGEMPGRKRYIATAEPFDEEMADRIARHRAERAAEWVTIEEPTNIAAVVRGTERAGVMLIDCLTLWLSNLLGTGLDDSAVLAEIEGLAGALAETPSSVVAVSNEVGSGIVPDNALARRFRDMAGVVNRRMAEAASEVYLLTAGIPLKLK